MHKCIEKFIAVLFINLVLLHAFFTFIFKNNMVQFYPVGSANLVWKQRNMFLKGYPLEAKTAPKN